MFGCRHRSRQPAPRRSRTRSLREAEECREPAEERILETGMEARGEAWRDGGLGRENNSDGVEGRGEAGVMAVGRDGGSLGWEMRMGGSETESDGATELARRKSGRGDL